ncbi:GD14997 [Drosophila simulans]|uniref:GD14997 n=1 Tax=Drosophila simulans TaxID=7240 RepID=B4QKM8_DROSI|nr:GD14997 [Drosophila simulans]
MLNSLALPGQNPENVVPLSPIDTQAIRTCIRHWNIAPHDQDLMRDYLNNLVGLAEEQH